ncbi:ECF transporter S component [Lentilactobacillus curieae]|uniref:Riboflavin transporter n=1 Tax=Lentilactobacillus curieae TaxID=1138822 RepID=A0A1S6QKI7_9LACO|nr:ECF transporter S component [Lentilactobacillus curieae]AQW22100.1 ECF transporter S component [Lentilactobacillus curieae]
MERSSKNRFVLTRTVQLSVLSAVSYVLMFISFPIIMFVPWMKVDFSDIPILLATVVFGPLAGLTVAGLKALLYWVTTGVSIPNFIGIFASFVSSGTLILGYELASKLFRNRNKWVKGFAIVAFMTIAITVVMTALNWAFVLPMYMQLIGFKLSMPLNEIVLYGVAPFNIIKGIIVAAAFLLVKGSLLPAFKRNH